MTNPLDNLTNLDQGSNAQFTRTWLGPSLGWAMLPVVPELLVTSVAPLVLGPYTSRVILKNAVKSVTLPSVVAWVNCQSPSPSPMSAFDRSIWIKDYAQDASLANPIIVSPSGTDTIDGLSSFSIITAGELIRLYVLSSLEGWYVG
jgi:hypothetical protein